MSADEEIGKAIGTVLVVIAIVLGVIVLLGIWTCHHFRYVS
jgi:hypothetical protein